MINRGSGAAVAAALVCGISRVAVAPSAATAATADHPILVGDQATNKIYRLNPATSAWDSWTWALEVTGPATAPGLREDPARTQVISLATGTGGDDVHDVAADHTDPDKLWITTNRYVYTYDKVTRQLVRAAAGIDRPGRSPPPPDRTGGSTCSP